MFFFCGGGRETVYAVVGLLEKDIIWGPIL